LKERGLSEAELPPAAKFDPQWRWIWRAWERLGLDRPYHGGGMGPPVPGNIPYLTVRQWASDHDMTRGEFEMLDACLRAMDKEYIAHWVSRQPQPPPPPLRLR
jgi:hypothetical protein